MQRKRPPQSINRPRTPSPTSQNISNQLEKILSQEIGEPFVQVANVFSTLLLAKPLFSTRGSSQFGGNSMADNPNFAAVFSFDLNQHVIGPDSSRTHMLADMSHLRLNPDMERYAQITAWQTAQERAKSFRAQEEADQRVTEWIGDHRHASLHSKIKDILSPLEPTKGELGYLFRLVRTLEKALPAERKARQKLLTDLDGINVPPIQPSLRFQLENESRTAIERIDKALVALASASALLKPYGKCSLWRRRRGMSHEQGRNFTRAGRGLTELLVREGGMKKYSAAHLAVDILCAYAPDYRQLGTDARRTIAERLRISLY